MAADLELDFDRVIDRTGTRSVKWDRVRDRAGVLPMWVADMDFRAPAPVVRALEERARFGVYGYTARGEDFAELIRAWLWRRHRWAVEPRWICPSPGVMAGLHAAIRAATRPGDAVVVQTPVYPPFFSAVTENGRRLVESPLRCQDGRYTVDLADLESKLAGAGALVLCNPHNPVARVWRPDELAAMAELCRRHGAALISDDIHCDVALDRYTPVAAGREAMGERLITLSSASKTFGLAGLNTAFAVVAGEELRARLSAELARCGFSHGNLFGDTALRVSFAEGEPWLDALLGYLRRNRALLEAAFGPAGPVRLSPIEGTYLAWLDFRATGLSEDEVTRLLLEEARVDLMRGSAFGERGRGFQRLTFACPAAALREGIDRIRAAFDRAR